MRVTMAAVFRLYIKDIRRDQKQMITTNALQRSHNDSDSASVTLPHATHDCFGSFKRDVAVLTLSGMHISMRYLN